MWKRLTNNQGSSLAESLTGLFIVCLITIVLIPSLFQMEHKLSKTKKEVEMWRLIHDVAANGGEEITRKTDRWLLTSTVEKNKPSISVETESETKRVILHQVLERSSEE